VSGEPLDQLISQTDPEGCHVINLPSRIWVLGGSCEDDPGKPISLRDSFWSHSLREHPVPEWVSHLDRPEAHDGWLEFSGYTNLLEFERDACYLARGMVLFAESPGAFAELGALAIEEFLLPRLHVVVQAKYLDEEHRRSFLNLGPLRRVVVNDGLCGINAQYSPQIERHEFLTILESVSSWLPKSRRKEKLDPSNPTHRLLLISDLADLLLVSKADELKRALNHFGVQIESEDLERSLNLLSFFRHVTPRLNGRRHYFLRHPDSEAPWIDYTGVSPNVFDRSRFKIATKEFIDQRPALRGILEGSQR
jgi:hypothetical protein